MHKLAHSDGEIATSRAASNENIAMGLSAYSTCSMEDVIAEGKGNPYVMQVTLLKKRTVTLRMIQRAESNYHGFFNLAEAIGVLTYHF